MSTPTPGTASLFGEDVGATLVTTLHARAVGAERHGVEGWADPQARAAWNVLDGMARERGITLEDLVLGGGMNTVGTVRRSQDMDARVREFAEDHGRIHVVTLGIGLCNRAARLDDLDASWVGVDSPDVAALRAAVLPDDVTRLVPGSVTDRDWLGEVASDRPTVLVAEGLLMYLTRAQVTQLLTRVGDHFTGPTRLIADLHHPLLVMPRAQIARLTGADYRFGVTSPRALAELVPGWRLVAADPTMARISTSAAVVSRVFGGLSRGQMYGVITIERDRDLP